MAPLRGGPARKDGQKVRGPESGPGPTGHWRGNPVQGEDRLEYRSHAVNLKDFGRLRRGKLSRKHEIDLHGFGEREAERALRDFLAHCQNQSRRCVLVIHGRGYGPSPPVLKNMANALLRQHPEVLAFCSAQQQHGGTGALYVLLRARRFT